MKKLLLVGSIMLLMITGCKTIWDNLFKVPNDYYKNIHTTKPLETKYTQMGSSTVKSLDFSVEGKRFKNWSISYPTELENSSKQYPVVIFANGTEFPYTKYKPVIQHLASWGFIAVGNDDGTSWDGLSSSQTLELLLAENNNPNSIFYKKINTSQIGISGHSQGGVAVVNAVNDHNNGNLYRSIFAASTTKHPLAVYLNWHYDMSKITIPYFAVAGVNPSDAGDGITRETGIAPLWSMQENLENLPKDTPTVLARRVATDHGQMLYQGDGYMTAWFLYTLLNDGEAKQVFVGNNAEIKSNSNWQDVVLRNIK